MTARRSPTSVKGRESLGRISLYLVGGVLAVYLATWVGPLAFYLEFQKPLMALERRAEHGVIWLEPQMADSSGKARIEEERWTRQAVGGVEVPLPPGHLVGAQVKDGLLCVQLKEGEILMERHTDGFVASLLRHQQTLLGVKEEAGPSDAAVLEEVARECLQKFHFRWSESERQRYAARLLCKMALWGSEPVRRFELASRGGSCAILVERTTGEAKVVATGPEGVLVISLPRSAPASWKTTAATWLD